MKCLSDEKIQQYIDGGLNSVERAMVRDHMITCTSCQGVYNQYEKLEKNLLQPVELMPPPFIERNVLNVLFPRLPSYSSIFALIAASFLLLVTWIYIYFDFANNSIIRAFQLTSDNTSNWLGSVIKIISSIFSAVYAVFKALNRFLHILFDINLGVEIIGLTVFLLFSLVFYSVFRAAFKKINTNT
jgi:predicted anti-sigma-YlaC factor YlaD